MIADAIKRLVDDKKPINRDSVRDYLQTSNVKTMQGPVSFDDNGDLKDRTISIFQITKDANYAADDMVHQFKTSVWHRRVKRRKAGASPRPSEYLRAKQSVVACKLHDTLATTGNAHAHT